LRSTKCSDRNTSLYALFRRCSTSCSPASLLALSNRLIVTVFSRFLPDRTSCGTGASTFRGKA
jgi:hypothetical protein